MQTSKANISLNIEDVLYVKEAFSSLSVDEVGKMLKAKNSSKGNKIVNSAHIHTSNINKCLKNSKSDIIADFIHITNNEIVTTTNKLMNDLNLSTIKKYLKNIKNVDLNSIESPRLPKSKLYMKIIRLL